MSHDRVENWETIGRTNRWIISIFIYFNVEEIEKGIHTYIYAQSRTPRLSVASPGAPTATVETILVTNIRFTQPLARN